jgi:hypothetical protein
MIEMSIKIAETNKDNKMSNETRTIEYNPTQTLGNNDINTQVYKSTTKTEENDSHQKISNKSERMIKLSKQRTTPVTNNLNKVSNIVVNKTNNTIIYTSVEDFQDLGTTIREDGPLKDNLNIPDHSKGSDWKVKNSKELRIYYQNVNSLGPQSLDKWKASLIWIKELQADVVGLTETCVNWNNKR